MFLLDTNIWLERLLGQGQAEVVAELLDTLAPSDMCMTDFTLHSIGVICKDKFNSALKINRYNRQTQSKMCCSV